VQLIAPEKPPASWSGGLFLFVLLCLTGALLAGSKPALGPSRERGLWRKSVLALEKGDAGSAARHLRTLLLYDPENPIYLSHLGTAYESLGDLRSMVEIGERLRRSSKPVLACAHLPGGYEALGEHARAEAAHRECMVMDPENPGGRLAFADFLERRGRSPEAASIRASLKRPKP